MNIDEIADFCEFTDCEVSFGGSEAGFVTVNGRGIKLKFNNYRRFLAQHELAALPTPEQTLKAATVFRVHRQEGTQELTRAEFEEQLRKFQRLAGV